MESKQLKWIYLVGLALFGRFIYFNSRIDWIISPTSWFLTDYFCCCFLLLIGFQVCQRFQKKKMEVYCDDFDVWDFFIPLFFSL
jgi:hypothetical protein